MPYIKTNKNGKFQVVKEIAFITLLEGNIPATGVSIRELFRQFDEIVRHRERSISREALSNVHGDWYEWLLGLAAWNYFVDNNSHLALLLPNVKQFNVGSLYIEELSSLIEDLREKVFKVAQVRLITSNPDFVIIDGDLARRIIQHRNKVDTINNDSISMITSLYREFIAKCDFQQLIGYTAIKTSFRPDRRLQIPHEGSLMKALYTHLQTRKWIINPVGLRYYAIATEVSKADREALRTVATHSIPTVSSLPQAAVDEVFEVNSLQQAHSAFEKILNT